MSHILVVEDEEKLARFIELELVHEGYVVKMALDKDGRDVFMADSAYVLQMAQQDYKHITFHFTSEF